MTRCMMRCERVARGEPAEAFWELARGRRACVFFFFNDTATTEIYTLSLHDALPICLVGHAGSPGAAAGDARSSRMSRVRSEEHTSELQSPCNLVCRLLLEKKKKWHVVPAGPAQHIRK